ncbi:MAG: class IV adenylate cyclase [Vicinamibacterales bacterium]
MAIEQEVKLAFSSLEAARHAVSTAGGRLLVSRRLLSDRLFDTDDARLRQQGATLRIRRDGPQGIVTWKGPHRPGLVKSREELETTVGDASILEAALVALGYQHSFSSEKYREEFDVAGAHTMIDDTPAGVFIEIEAAPDDIARVSVLLGKTPLDYRLESYPTLWRAWCREHGQPPSDMLFSYTTPAAP